MMLSVSLIILAVIVLLLLFWYWRLSQATELVLMSTMASKKACETVPAITPAPVPVSLDIGVSTGIYYEKDILEVLQPIREAGYTTVEIWAGPQRWGEYTHFNWHKPYRVHALSVCLKVLGMKVHSLHAPFTDTLDISDTSELRRKYAVDEILRTMEVLKFLGGEYLIVHPASNDNSLKDRDIRFAQSRKSIEELYSCMQGMGLKMAVENQLPHILGGDVNTLLALINGLPPQEVGICFDTSHATMYHGQPVENTLKALGGRLMTVHLSDNYGHSDDHFIPGDGCINWGAVVDTLNSIGYRGVYMMEIQADANRSDKQWVLRNGYQRARERFSAAKVAAV